MSTAALIKQNRLDIERILKQPEGARFIAGLIDLCGLFADNPKEGAREVGLTLYRYVLACPGGEAAYIKGRGECLEIAEKTD